MALLSDMIEHLRRVYGSLHAVAKSVDKIRASVERLNQMANNTGDKVDDVLDLLSEKDSANGGPWSDYLRGDE